MIGYARGYAYVCARRYARGYARAATLSLAATVIAAAMSLPCAARDLVGLPQGASIIVSAGFEGVRSQPDAEKNLTDLLAQSSETLTKYNEFKTKTGVDPLKDLDSISVGIFMDPTGDMEKTPDFVCAVAGRFDAAKLASGIEAMAAEHNVKMIKSTYKGVTVYSRADKKKETAAGDPAAGDSAVGDSANDQGFWAVTSQHGVISNKEARLKESLDLIKSGKAISLEPKLKALVDKADQTATVWAAGMLPQKPQKPAPVAAVTSGSEAQQNMGGEERGDPVKNFVVSFDSKSGINLKVDLDCRDAQATMMIKNQVEGMRGMVGMMTLQSAGNLPAETTTKFNEILQKLVVTTNNDQASISFVITKDDLDQLKKVIEALKAASAQKGAQRRPGGRGPGAGSGPGPAPAGF